MAKHVLASAERTIDAPAHDVYRYLGDMGSNGTSFERPGNWPARFLPAGGTMGTRDVTDFIYSVVRHAFPRGRVVKKVLATREEETWKGSRRSWLRGL